ncbi:hypothetical protein Sgleb_75900 [Streptomyces glebosus]|uniref:N-acetyltransferase domain-containing protein n=1 Tax=Streptomyces glebosus TaxID=249580 RepID=A0A640T732_9ACTN|nr:hypothetical protein Sgleb_00040 [Streptomyces glebosus]GFE19543.1 hypothetical protein Sgleb_75900 [Streptomyces glebosus]
MVTLRELTTDDAQPLARIYSGASVRHTTGKPLTLDQAHEKIRTALARAAETPRAQWSWGIVATDEMIGLISLRRRSSSLGTLSYILPGATATPPKPPSTSSPSPSPRSAWSAWRPCTTPTIRPPAVSWPKSASPAPAHPTGASRTDPLCRTRCTHCRCPEPRSLVEGVFIPPRTQGCPDPVLPVGAALLGEGLGSLPRDPDAAERRADSERLRRTLRTPQPTESRPCQ